MFWALKSDIDNTGACLIASVANEHETLIEGCTIDETSLKLPWPFGMEVDSGNGDPDQLDDFYDDTGLMSARLIEVLKSVGATNLQLFPASIKRGKRKALSTYVVVNVLGRAKARIKGTRKAVLTVDRKSVGTMKVFMLPGGSIGVTQEVKDALGEQGFDSLRFEALGSE